METRKQKEHQLKTTINAIFAAIDRHDFESFANFFVHDAVCRIAGIPEEVPIDVGAGFIQTFIEAFPDSRHVIRQVIAEEDEAAVRFVLCGTHQGYFNGISPTGNPVQLEGMHFYRFSAGKIEKMWIVEDKLSLLRQLGMELRPKDSP